MDLGGQGDGQRRVLDLLFMAEFEVAHPQRVRQLHRTVDQPVPRRAVVGQDAVAVQVGEADQEAPEQQTANEGQRQEAARPVAVQGLQGVHVVVEGVGQDVQPGGIAAERRRPAGQGVGAEAGQVGGQVSSTMDADGRRARGGRRLQ